MLHPLRVGLAGNLQRDRGVGQDAGVGPPDGLAQLEPDVRRVNCGPPLDGPGGRLRDRLLVTGGGESAVRVAPALGDDLVFDVDALAVVDSDLMINPGSRPVESASESLAAENLQAFIDEATERGLHLADEPIRRPEADADGRYAWTVLVEGGNQVQILMPGVPLEHLRTSALRPTA